MGRPKQYDRATVLRRAYEKFWANGYESTSVQDLLESMHLNRGSLYADFEDKRSLFLHALRQYRAEVVQPRLEAMQSAPSARDGIHGFFAALVAQCQSKKGSTGCLATNSAAELAPRDAGVAEELAAGMRRIEDAFAVTLRRGVKAREFRADLPVRATARYLVGLAQGSNVLGKVIREPGYLSDVVTAGLRSLD